MVKEILTIEKKSYLKILLSILLLFGLYLTILHSYLLFHCLAEIFSIVVACGIFMLAWNSRRFLDNTYLLFIGIAYLFVGSLDLIHTLSYKGMGVFQGYGTNLPTQLWITARYMESLSFLIAPFFLGRGLKTNFVFLGYSLAISLLLGSIFYWNLFPECFVEGMGLTPFKKISEYIISLFLFASIATLFKKRREFDTIVLRLLIASIILTIVSELAFTLYVHAYGLPNLIGHYLKIISFYLIYKAIIETGLARPYTLLFRNLKQSEEALQKAHAELEQRVEERTTELRMSNKQLKLEIEERTRSEKKLQKSKAMLRMVFEGISDPLIMLDKDLSVMMLNIAAKEYYKLPEYGDFIDKPCHRAFHGRFSPCDGCNIVQAISNGEALTIERMGRMDSERFEQVAIYPVKAGAEEGAIVRISDITESKLLQKQVTQSEKLASIGLLLSGITHEINNPNNFITFNIPIMRDYLQEIISIIDDYAESHQDFELFGMSYPEFRKDIFTLLDNMEHGSSRINAIVSRLREFTIMKGKEEKHWADLKYLIEKGIAICQSEVTKKVKSLTVDIPEALPKILTNPEALEQILINLVINAAHAADKEDSWVSINVRQEGTRRDHVIIEVSDNGSGIDEKNRGKIFDPFFTDKSYGTGTGLGLYICQNLIESLGGHIEVESEPGKGSTFRVIVPDGNPLSRNQ